MLTKESLPVMRTLKLALPLLILFAASFIFGQNPAYFHLLTVAQVIYVPLMIKLAADASGRTFFSHRSAQYLTGAAVLSVCALHLIPSSGAWNITLAAVYLIYAFALAVYGIRRFLRRGFVHLEEISIEIGFMYIAVGGLWFFAHVANVDTGFSPIITWLTAIHFHYAAFLLPVFVGLFGRLHQSSAYRRAAGAVIAAPILLALGIAFSTWLEIGSVLLYIAGVYTMTHLIWKTAFRRKLQKICLIIAFVSLSASLLLSLMYAVGNAWEPLAVSIGFMLQFHGLTNSVLFALFGVLGWMMDVPPPRANVKSFPLSRVRGKRVIGETILPGIQTASTEQTTARHHAGSGTRSNDNGDDAEIKGLVDDMRIYEPDLNLNALAPSIIDFYQHTTSYRLKAEVRWKSWFKPLAALYRLLSKRVQQIHLPLRSTPIEMTGSIVPIDEAIDGRVRPRAWVRKVNDETAFVALYSWHRSEDNTYMNIALPLPKSAMIGILELRQQGRALQLSSIPEKADGRSDAGIYLAWGNVLTALPLQETFLIEETSEGKLRAHHRMWIFSVPFLDIEYEIWHKSLDQP